MATTPPAAMEDQGRLLEEALGVVRQQSMMMRKCLETPGKLMDALKCGYVVVVTENASRLTELNLPDLLLSLNSERPLLVQSSTMGSTWLSLMPSATFLSTSETLIQSITSPIYTNLYNMLET